MWIQYNNQIKYLIIVIWFGFVNSDDTLRIATYNILNYDGDDRTSHLATVNQSYDADIIIVQKMLDQTGVNTFDQDVLNNEYATIPFNNGPDTDNHIVGNLWIAFYNIKQMLPLYCRRSICSINQFTLRVIN